MKQPVKIESRTSNITTIGTATMLIVSTLAIGATYAFFLIAGSLRQTSTGNIQTSTNLLTCSKVQLPSRYLGPAPKSNLILLETLKNQLIQSTFDQPFDQSLTLLEKTSLFKQRLSQNKGTLNKYKEEVLRAMRDGQDISSYLLVKSLEDINALEKATKNCIPKRMEIEGRVAFSHLDNSEKGTSWNVFTLKSKNSTFQLTYVDPLAANSIPKMASARYEGYLLDSHFLVTDIHTDTYNTAAIAPPVPTQHESLQTLVIQGHPRSISNPQTFNPELLAQRIYGDKDFSVKTFYNSNSYGQLDIIGSNSTMPIDNIVGPFSFAISATPEECNSDLLAQAIVTATDAQIQFNEETIIIALITNKICSNFSGVFYGDRFTTNDSASPLYLRLAIVMNYNNNLPLPGGLKTIAHELGHNFMGRIGHAGYLSCNPSDNISPEACATYYEYGNPYDAMGTSVKWGHGNAQTMEHSGWLQEEGQHRIQTIESDGTYYLKPLSSQSEGVKALRLPYTLTRQGIGEQQTWFMTVEWRQPIELDALSSEQLPLYESNEFEGVLLNLDTFGNHSLIHPVPRSLNYPCSDDSCLWALETVLPYNSDYINPNTKTRIHVGPEPALGDDLAIAVNEGRWDFTPPRNLTLDIVARSEDGCEVTYEGNAEDESGLSAYEFILTGITTIESHQTVIHGEEIPAQITIDFRNTQVGLIDLSLYDNASGDGQLGLLPNNFSSISRQLLLDSSLCSSETRAEIQMEFPGTQYIINSNVNIFQTLKLTNPITTHINVQADLPLRFVSLEIENNGPFFQGCGQACPPLFIEFDIGANQYINDHTFRIFRRLRDGRLPYEYPLLVTASVTPGNQNDINYSSYFNIQILDPIFIRGDVNGDRRVNITDGIKILNNLFLGGETINCLDSADSNDDGLVSLVDAQRIFNKLFLDQTVIIPEPFNIPGHDITKDDELGCYISQYPTLPEYLDPPFPSEEEIPRLNLEYDESDCEEVTILDQNLGTNFIKSFLKNCAEFETIIPAPTPKPTSGNTPLLPAAPTFSPSPRPSQNLQTK